MNLKFVYPIVHAENTNLVDIYLEIMNHIKIWIKDIYELDTSTETWKSSNTYKLPKQVFFSFFFIYFII